MKNIKMNSDLVMFLTEKREDRLIKNMILVTEGKEPLLQENKFLK